MPEESSSPPKSPQAENSVESSSGAPGESPGESLAEGKRSLAGIAGIVAIATLLSKFMGLARQMAIAAAFGVGAAVGAYEFASIIPGFFLILLGGINGPFHSALVSALAKRNKKDAAPLVETVSTLVGIVLLAITVGIVIAAPLLIDLIAPGLGADSQVRLIAIQQLRIMAPMAWFAGMIGIGFGALNAADMYWLPSISPLLSSLAIIGGIGVLAVTLGENIIKPEFALIGGIVLAATTMGGTVLQWLIQMLAQRKEGLGKLRLRFNWRDPGVADVTNVLGPALFASGMLQINVYTDMFFTSFLPDPGASVASLNYANLLVQAPLGILSNMILVPFLPVFSRLRDPADWPELKDRIRQGVVLTAIAMLPIGALMMALAGPIVRVAYQRGAFSEDASTLVASVLMAYAVGMFVYLGRDVLVRVFYGLGDGNTPFRISMANIGLNALLDFLFIRVFGWGTPGLVLATVGVNVVSMGALLWLLHKRLGGLPLRRWGRPISGLLGASIVCGVVAFWLRQGITNLLPFSNFLSNFIAMAVPGLIGLGIFALLASQLRLAEFDDVAGRLSRKLLRR